MRVDLFLRLQRSVAPVDKFDAGKNIDFSGG